MAPGKKDNIWLALLVKCIYPSWNISSRLGDFLFQLFFLHSTFITKLGLNPSPLETN